MSRGAVAVGYAWRTPLGAAVPGAVKRLLAGERAARDDARFPPSAYACRLAALVDGAPAASPHRRFLGRMGLFGLEVAIEALEMASSERFAPERLGLFCAVGGLRVRWDALLPALAGQSPTGEDAWARGLRGLHPFWMLEHLSNNAHALISVDVQALGEGVTFGGALAGVEAIAAAARALETGAVDRALVVAYDALVEPEILVDLAARGVVSQAALAELRAPYDVYATGVVPGEAAAALVLERARARAGASFHVDATTGADGSEGEPQASLLAEVASRLLAAHGPVALVDGAARAVPRHDAAEREAMAGVVGGEMPLTAVGAGMGATGAAAGVVRAIALAESLRLGLAPPIAGLERAAEGPLRPLLRAEPVAGRAALALIAGAPGLAGAVRVEVAG